MAEKLKSLFKKQTKQNKQSRFETVMLPTNQRKKDIKITIR